MDKQSFKIASRLGYFPVIEACIVGLAAGASALVLGAGINWLGSLRVDLSETRSALEVLPLFGLLGGLLSGFLLLLAPDISGSGIPQVRAVLSRMSLPLNLKIAFAKLIGGTIALGSGLFMGREGPTVQVGAAIAGQIARWIPTTVEHRRSLIAAGAGAGLAAAFSAPIAGVVFVVEELLKEYKATSVALAIVACFSASLVEHFFGTPHKFVYSEALAQGLKFDDLLSLVALGIACGFFGALFNRGILLSLKLFRASKLPRPARVGLAGLLTGLVVALLPVTLHDYAATRAMVNSGTMPGDTVPLIFAAFSMLTFIAYGSGAPGGLFAPSLTIGSAIGSMVGVADLYWTGSGSVHLYSLVGMGAFFSAVSRAPLTSIVIVFEMASDFSLVAPLMVACVIASAVGDYFYKGGLYDLLMVWNGLHLSRSSASGDTATVQVRDLMEENFGTLASGSTLKEAIAAFERLDVQSLPVLKGNKLVGVLLRSSQPSGSSDEIGGLKIDDLMVKPPLAVNPHDTADEVLYLFAQYKFEWLPVTNSEDVLMGIIRQKSVVTRLFGA